jgi:hypothetical protein
MQPALPAVCRGDCSTSPSRSGGARGNWSGTSPHWRKNGSGWARRIRLALNCVAAHKPTGLEARTGEDPTSRRIFTTADASRIVGVPAASTRRWLPGYSYSYKGSTRTQGPRLGPSALPVEGVLLMNFLDLIEIQLAVALRRRKITWPKICKAAEMFRQEWNSRTPLLCSSSGLMVKASSPSSVGRAATRTSLM